MIADLVQRVEQLVNEKDKLQQQISTCKESIKDINKQINNLQKLLVEHSVYTEITVQDMYDQLQIVKSTDSNHGFVTLHTTPIKASERDFYKQRISIYGGLQHRYALVVHFPYLSKELAKVQIYAMTNKGAVRNSNPIAIYTVNPDNSVEENARQLNEIFTKYVILRNKYVTEDTQPTGKDLPADVYHELYDEPLII